MIPLPQEEISAAFFYFPLDKYVSSVYNQHIQFIQR